MSLPRPGIGQTITLDTSTATERIRERLRLDIVTGAFVSGDRLKIVDIANRLGVSPLPVREALRLLSGEGLVEMLPHRGAMIRPVDRSFVIDMYDIRQALEAMLAERVVERIQPGDLRRLTTAHDAYARAAEKLDVPAMLATNAAFHGSANAIAGNVEAARMLGRGWEIIRAMRLRFGFTVARAQTNVAQHRAILEAFSAGDAARAARATREHCITGRDDLLQCLDDAHPAPPASSAPVPTR